MNSKMIIAKDKEYSLNSYETRLNNNVIVVGGSGAGKTTSVVIPNILQATGSYIVTDPKGNLYRKLSQDLQKKGYRVLSLDLSNPNGLTRYNFIDYIQEEHDVIKIAHVLMSAAGSNCFYGENAFFYNTGELVVASALAMMKFIQETEKDSNEFMKITSILNYAAKLLLPSDDPSDNPFYDIDPKGNAWFDLGKRLITTIEGGLASETATSILATIGSVLGKLNTHNVERMMLSVLKFLDLRSIGLIKTALFVRVSDTDRSLDALANIFFTQAMDVLCHLADTMCKNESLPIPVRFIMDDFATNCTIEDFPRMISSIRSRNISVMLLLQAESQLEERYGRDAATIIGNCDTYLYMGGNDLNTAKRVAERADIPYSKILSMPVGSNWIFRRGEKPVNGENYCPVFRL